jgi:hypothetical protein
MNLVLLTYPGTFLVSSQGAGDHDTFTIENLLHAIEGELVSCAIALDDFQRANRPSPVLDIDSGRKEWEETRDLRMRILDEVVQRRGLDPFEARRDRGVALAVSRSFHEQRLAAGREPDSYSHKRPFVYARAFLLSADLVLKIVRALSKVASVPPGLGQVVASLETSLPGLSQVRNSSAHLEDRVRGLDMKGKTITSKPYAGVGITAGGGMSGMLLENLEGTLFTSTLADGGHGSLDVTADTLSILVAHAQQVIEIFPWRGSPRVVPY